MRLLELGFALLNAGAQHCVRNHTKAALRAGALPEELMEAIWVAAEMRAGGASAHATIALAVMEEAEQPAAG